MGYACPVCEDPQADAGHLANHMAFTAMLGDDAHGAWLDENAPGWGAMGESELADALGDLVAEIEFPQVFEDTVGGLETSDESPAERSGALFDESGGHEHAGPDRGGRPGQPGGDLPDPSRADAGGPMDEETAAILEEAREMTRAMMGGDEDVEDGRTDRESDGCDVDDEDQDTGEADQDTDADGSHDRGDHVDRRGEDHDGEEAGDDGDGGVDGNENG